MTTSAAQEPVKPGVGALVRGFTVGVLSGAAIACLVVGPVIDEAYVFVLGLVLPAVAIVLMTLWRKASKRRHGPRPEPRMALARIENRRARSSESGDIPVEFVLTVAPDDAPAYRVECTEDINLVDIPDYKQGKIIVVRYRPHRPWDVGIVSDPDESWARRAAVESIDSAPESTLVSAPLDTCGACMLSLVGILIGAALVVFAYRDDLFDDSDGGNRTSTTTVTTTSTSSTSVTITGEVMLLPGEMRRAAEELIALAGTDKAVAFSIDEDFMSLEAPKPTDPRLVDSFKFRDDKVQTQGPRGTRDADDPLIDLRALPYERLVLLVFEAKTTLGINAPKSWHIAFHHDPISKALVINVSVLDDYGAASLTTDAQGNVTARSPR